MKLKSKIIMVFLSIFLLFGVASCGSPTGEVSFKNFDDILVQDTVNNVDGSTYNDVILALGSPTEDSNYIVATESGYLEWSDSSGEYYVKVTFVDGVVTEKTSDGLYSSVYESPITEESTGAWQWVIKQLGFFTLYASNLFGLLGSTHLYWLGLLIMTLVIRTIGWPIYAKTNDMSLKMQEKYRNRQDQASQQRMQMETMEIYRKYKINLFGCLMPLLQMPIFIAMYQVVRRFPLQESLEFFTNGNPSIMNMDFLWTNLGNTAWLANLPLAIVVSAVMFLSQWLSQHRTKVNQRPNQYAGAKAQQTQNSMKYVMYGMVVMMGVISLQNAGIAWYWIIGTSYQLLQSYISFKNMTKRQEKLRKQF
jgi:YidC/Oxa1 family membrane protein insertase